MKRFAAILALALLPFVAHAAEPQSSTPVTRTELEKLATELAPKVNLFRDVWAKVPEAEFFGGTSRDYLYWLKGRLVSADREGRLGAEIAELRATKTIDVRSFILFESDVDVAAEKTIGVDGARYGIKKIDHISSKRFDPATPEGQSEIRQGFIPVEKIRLGRNGFAAPTGFGDGLDEIHRGRPTVHFASKADFDSTHYARMGVNHPILLALRYLRLLGINYFQSHGEALPDRKILLSEIDSASAAKVRQVVDDAVTKGELSPLIQNEKFKTWLNSTIQKAFRSYTNPTAAKMLYEAFGADRLPLVYNGIEPINQYLFRKHRDPKLIAANWKKFGLTPTSVAVDYRSAFPDGFLYHGTHTEQAFRSILFQGILPSSGGSAGAGLYGVADRNVEFAAKWSRDERLVVMLEIDSSARIVDIRSGPGQDLFERYKQSETGNQTEIESKFAEAFGIDILVYTYPTEAYVVKNAEKIKSAQGWKRKLLRLDDLRRYVKSRTYDLKTLFDLAADNGLNQAEINELFSMEAVLKSIEAAGPVDAKKLLSHPDFEIARKSAQFYMIPFVADRIGDAMASLTKSEMINTPEWLEDLLLRSGSTVGRTIHALYYSNIHRLLDQMNQKDLESMLVEAKKNGKGVVYATDSAA
ncbi:MAG: hypothetical protein V4760_04950, partial [Bdellovibrionota bacterium]